MSFGSKTGSSELDVVSGAITVQFCQVSIAVESRIVEIRGKKQRLKIIWLRRIILPELIQNPAIMTQRHILWVPNDLFPACGNKWSIPECSAGANLCKACDISAAVFHSPPFSTHRRI